MKTTRLILVGGFLGAGKTTLLFEASKRLMSSGKRIGLITNDQAPELVDTALLLYTGAKVTEVSGSCFCCNYDGFIRSIHEAKEENQADIILAEPVGSCTDLSATIMQPLKDHLKTELLVSPLTILADPWRLKDILAGGTAGLHPSAAYIFLKQLEEADMILISKSDVLKPEESRLLKEKVKLNFPGSEVLSISAKTGEGMESWLAAVIRNTGAGKRIAAVDYDRYAEGEAVLGWLNTTISLQGNLINWDKFALEFLSELSKKIDHLEISVGHIKVIVEAGTHYVIGSLTGKSDTLSLRGSAGIHNHAQIIINARAGTSPESLEQIVNTTLYSVAKDSITLKTEAHNPKFSVKVLRGALLYQPHTVPYLID